jgi:hypothetical protein
MMLSREVTKDLIKSLDVISSIVGRKCDSGQQYLDLGIVKSGQNRVEVATRLVGRNSAKPVVAAEFNDHNGGMKLENRAKVGNGILGGSTARAAIRYGVMVAKLVEIPLQGIGEGLAGCEAISRGNAVAVADDEGAIRSEERAGEETEAKRNDNPAGNVHINSVKAQIRNGPMVNDVVVVEAG